MILLNPGPVNLSDGVRNALAGADICHREPEFADLQEAVRQRLLDAYGLASQDWAAVVLTGSGTAAMEAMVTSLVPDDGKVLVIENGVYGERLTTIARLHGIQVQRLNYRWGEPFSLPDLTTALNGSSAITHLALVHHETTTGRLNDLAKVGALCRSRGVALLVDAISSFGAEELDFEGWGISGCAGVANKCLHGAPGAAFVIVRRASLLTGEQAPRRTLYLDLANYCREQDAGSTPFTQSVQVFYAFAKALQEFAEQGGWRSRQRRYRHLAGKVREGLGELGVRPLLPEQAGSVVLSAFRLPHGVSYAGLHDALKRRGFVIYAGQGALVSGIFRVSTMGAIDDADIDRFLCAMEDVLRDAQVA